MRGCVVFELMFVLFADMNIAQRKENAIDRCNGRLKTTQD
jgi:hypothetical protein